MEVIFVAVIVSVIAPTLLAFLTNRQRITERRMDWDRQDAREKADRERQEAVAKQAAEAAELLLAEQRATKARTEEVAVLAARAASATDSQLKQIHTLVNSDMTAARQELLDQTRLLVSIYRKTIEDDRAAGREATPSDLAALDAAEAKVSELQGILADRLAQQRIVEQEQKVERAAADAPPAEG
jgi:uncharacterized membrane-anchored protein YhcB (DUF1043 family)